MISPSQCSLRHVASSIFIGAAHTYSDSVLAGPHTFLLPTMSQISWLRGAWLATSSLQAGCSVDNLDFESTQTNSMYPEICKSEGHYYGYLGGPGTSSCTARGCRRAWYQILRLKLHAIHAPIPRTVISPIVQVPNPRDAGFPWQES